MPSRQAPLVFPDSREGGRKLEDRGANARRSRCWVLLLLLVLLADPALALKMKKQAVRELEASSIYIVQADHLAKPSVFPTLKHWYVSMVDSTDSPRGAVDTRRLVYTYDTVMRGFAVELTSDEARRMSCAPGVLAMYQDRRVYPLTTRSPGFLGLDPRFGAWRDTDLGDGVIIGIIDTGIWPESPSFNGKGLGPVRSSWRGKCVDADDFNSSLCNKKLVGAKSFIKGASGVPSPRDDDGHGTLMASTAAGSESEVGGPDVLFARGTARGVAPKARIAVYKVPTDGATAVDIVAAFDEAVKDGVDIMSISLGYEASPFYADSLAVAAFVAERKGVFVVLAGGNSEPTDSTVINVAPWMTTVGASTIDRLFPAILNLGDGSILTGESLYPVKANHTAAVPLALVTCEDEEMTPEKVSGKIVVCFHGAVDDSQSYMDSATNPTASFSFACETVVGENRAPTVMMFSSRGPNPVVPELLKPDIVAPGVNILAASFHRDQPRRSAYMMESGTSMSCPHVAGVAALIKKKHPGWTPAMIRSALVTTAGVLDNNDRPILDVAVFLGRGVTAATPFAAGAGHVRPQLAMDPGLVYDADARDYIDFLCALNYTPEQLRLFAPDLATCTGAVLPGGPAGLNYPSFVVVFNNGNVVRTLTRRVTKVSEEAEVYTVTVVAPDHVKVTITPPTLEFKDRMDTRSYSAEFTTEAGGHIKAGYAPDDRSADSGQMPEQHALHAESKRQEVLQLDNEIDYNEAIIEEWEQAIQDIQEQIGEVHEIFKDLATLVHSQGVVIEEIDTNLENSAAATKEAKTEVAKASKTQKSNSSLFWRLGLRYPIFSISKLFCEIQY
ncbi:unnamed protein product [Urochloa decumbens]|uniref:t-SNARE coiled-coil homology domain-containing protein n=1 Tax=Urochloa decumbens TaxID=240449 RepID=A0ABC8WKM3_9POAL